MARRRLMIATVLLLVAFAAAVVWLVRSQGAYYRQVGELSAELDGKTVKVGGTVQAGALGSSGRFYILDLTGAPDTVAVVYNGALPETFGPGVEIVVVGAYDNATRTILAEELQTKCPSKYQASQSPSP